MNIRTKFSEEQLKEEFGKDLERMGGYEGALRVKFEADYLESLVQKGAIEKYGETIDPDTQERIIFELQVIKSMGFPGYFLIVQDFINAARKMGVIVGPGRGFRSRIGSCLHDRNYECRSAQI